MKLCPGFHLVRLKGSNMVYLFKKNWITGREISKLFTRKITNYNVVTHGNLDLPPDGIFFLDAENIFDEHGHGSRS